MIKHILFAVAPLCLLASGAFASDNLLDEVASLNASSIDTAEISIEDASLDLNVDALSADADNGEDAIEACFRRFYSCYGGYHGGCYGYNYHCYQPCYSYYYCYRPVYTYCYTPVYYHYWGCY